MTDLPLAVTSPAPIARAAAANAASRGAQEHDGTTQPGSTSFQDALAQEIGEKTDSLALPGMGVPATAALADSERKGGEDALQIAAAADAAPACASLSALPTDIPGMAPAAALAAGFVAPVPAQGASALAPTRTQSASEIALPALEPRAAPLAQAYSAARADSLLTAAPRALDFAVPGSHLSAAAAESRFEITFNRGLPEQALPAATAAIQAYAAPAPPAQLPTAALNPVVGEHGWNQALGDQLVWMASHKHQVAELHLNPPDLGPLKITLTLDSDKASAQFYSAHAVVREAIETAMPRLREMLADVGVTLGDANVGAESFRDAAQPQGERHEARAYPAAEAAAATPAAVTQGARLLHLARGLVDTFV